MWLVVFSIGDVASHLYWRSFEFSSWLEMLQVISIGDLVSCHLDWRCGESLSRLEMWWVIVLDQNCQIVLNAAYGSQDFEHNEIRHNTLNIMTLSIMTLNIMTLIIITLSIMAFSIMAFSTMAFSIMTLSTITLLPLKVTHALCGIPWEPKLGELEKVLWVVGTPRSCMGTIKEKEGKKTGVGWSSSI